MTNPILNFDNVTFAIDGIEVLSDVSFSAQSHESICVVGPNGGGKSTLLKLALGLLEPSRGTITVLGTDPIKARRKVGYMPQYLQYDQRFPVSVLDVALMGRLSSHRFGFYSKQDKVITMQALDEMGVANLAKRHFGALSGGQRQRVLIARALACEPELLLLDEPTANVDPSVENQFVEILHQLAAKITVVTVTHDLGFVSQLVDRVICVNRFVKIHPTSEITGEIIQDIYGGDLKMVRHDHCCSEQGHAHDRLF
ncbi:MAG: metal ABC transporter ATP-binding protein [Proteobacteria bacterium]|nr:metal ABC transporter ATP-binding protein [Pseudomonadota bacterium]MBU1640415.1 metal ABC transporter ATP-binding protein [Pseudomonadota bacterium]